jgi:hypothetical protein
MTMILIDEAQIILNEAGYKTKLSIEVEGIVYFEDRSLLGLAAVYLSVQELLDKWKKQEAEFLMRHAKKLRTAPQKAWNVYSVFLTGEEIGNASLRTQLLAIDEDFQGTRKIARAGLISHADVVRALLPLLPIQNRVTLASEDLFLRLRDRVELPERSLLALLKGVDSKEIANMLLEEE